MPKINAAALEESIQFQRGKPLPTADVLIDLLNRLSRAKEDNKLNEKFQLESRIRDLVAPGIYEGYRADDLTIGPVRVKSVKRRGAGANIHTFLVEIDILDGTTVTEATEIELIDFLREVNRERSTGGQHLGPRFWPL